MATAFGLRSSHVFEGNDGPWSTFQIAVGTPLNLVNVLPGSSLSYLLVTDSSFCAGAAGSELTTCEDLRGGLFDSSTSSTFFNVSNPASANGQFKLSFPYEERLDPLQCSSDCTNTGAGYYSNTSSLFGTDTVSLGYNNDKNTILSQQLIAAFAGAEPELGLLGLARPPFNFSGIQSYASPLQALRDKQLTPSQYWAYTAGSNQLALDGSLTIGGYDKNRGDVANAPYWSTAAGTPNLAVEVSKISISGQNGANFTASYVASIDTTVPELWLPSTTCDAFEAAFGLTWNETWEMYLLSSEQRQSLRDQNPTVTFTLDGSNLHGSDGGQALTLSYASFDLEVRWPLGGITDIDTSSYYFPLKRAQTEDQYTLGRAFFQETYLAVDYDRERFCIAPAPTSISGEANLVTVNNRKSSGLSSGAIAGIAVAGVAVLLGVILLAFFLLRKRRKRRSTFKGNTEGQQPPQMEETLPGPLRTFYETDGKPKVQAQSPQFGPAYPKAELHGDFPDSRDRSRTLSGSTLPISPISQGNRGVHSRTLSQESQVQSIQSHESQQSQGFPLPSPPEELEARGPHELEGWRPGEVDGARPARLETPQRVNDLPSRFVIQS